MALNKLGDFLMTRGDPKDADQALRCREESLEILRRLHEKKPESAQAATDLFYAMYNMPIYYRKAGKLKEALKTGGSIGTILMEIEERGFNLDNNMKILLLALKSRCKRVIITASCFGMLLLVGIGYTIWRML